MAIQTNGEKTQLIAKEIKIIERVEGTHTVNGKLCIKHSLDSVKMHVNHVGLETLNETFYKSLSVDIATLPPELQKLAPAVVKFFTDVTEHEINKSLNGVDDGSSTTI